MPADLSEQIQRFEEKFAENPDSLVFARLADLYRKAGDAERALALLEEGLERHPDYLSAHIVRARCLRDLDREDEAEQAFARVLEHDEQNLVALRGLAELAREQGNPDQAERKYEELLALDPHNQEARSALDELVGGGPVGPQDGPPEETSTEEPEDGEPPGPDDGGADADDDAPWWKSGGPADTAEPDEPIAPRQPDDTAAPDGPGETPPAGADQSDVFSLAGPEEEAGGVAGGEAETGTGPDVREADDPREGDGGAATEGATESAPGDEDDPWPPGTPGPASREEAEFLGLDEEDGSAGGSPGDAADGGLSAEKELTERIEEIAETDEGAVPEADVDSEDLLTETLADLYETQGFYREAVEMYEELLEDRPDDEELRARLEAARSAMGEAAAADGAHEADEAPGGPAAVDPVPGGSEGRTSGGGDDTGDGAGGGTSPDDAAAARGRASARSHLQALLRGEAEETRAPSVSEGPEPAP